jgi:enoyl-CoA hydratase/carnithine racemase
MSEPEILCDVQGAVATVTLNRPAALNALSLGMVLELKALFRRFAADDGVRVVLLRGSGDKAFCAGGDIRALYQSFKTSGSLHREFFVEEYALDYSLYEYPKPCLVVLDGIAMGGGMGLAQGSTLRIVGDRTRIAMPEVGIGLFPDVGASWFLSRLGGSLGPYLALTGEQLRGVDAVYAGLADVYLTPAAIAALPDDLAAIAWSADPHADVRALLKVRSAAGLPDAPLRTLRPAIDAHFCHDTVAAVLASLEAEGTEGLVAWAGKTAKLLRSRSPTMLAVSLRQLRQGATLSLAACFRMELGMVQECFVQGDFLEGVRALIIDRDNAPRWRPAHLDEVSEASVAAFFRDRWSTTAHPLAGLEASTFHRGGMQPG